MLDGLNFFSYFVLRGGEQGFPIITMVNGQQSTVKQIADAKDNKGNEITGL